MTPQFAFIKTFGDYPLIRVLDFLIYSRDFDYPLTEIAKNAGVNFQTLKKIWPQLEENKIIIKTRTLAGATLYKINMANPVVKKIIELNNFLCWKQVEEQKEDEPLLEPAIV
ncbi:MAG: hypothetical protein Q7R76_05905 [Candidatus Woesearchaeota archaeon]|nr:hypothetical protein [Candidatus Woesearchaeota archaeon]